MTIRAVSDYELMQFHIQALYRHDDTSRMTAINEWRGGTAPRFFLGRTQAGNVWRFRHDVPRDICEALARVCQTEPPATTQQPAHVAAYQCILAKQAPIQTQWSGSAYWFPHEAVPTGQAVPISAERAHLLAGGLSDWIPDIPHQQPFVAVLVEGQAVAVCASVRITAQAHEAGVETLAAYRRQGYATAAVSAWAHLVQKQGALALYSTSFNNAASQKTAARLGLSLYGVGFHIT